MKDREPYKLIPDYCDLHSFRRREIHGNKVRFLAKPVNGPLIYEIKRRVMMALACLLGTTTAVRWH